MIMLAVAQSVLAMFVCLTIFMFSVRNREYELTQIVILISSLTLGFIWVILYLAVVLAGYYGLVVGVIFQVISAPLILYLLLKET